MAPTKYVDRKFMTRRELLQWVTPVITTATLAAHAEASPETCCSVDRVTWRHTDKGFHFVRAHGDFSRLSDDVVVHFDGHLASSQHDDRELAFVLVELKHNLSFVSHTLHIWDEANECFYKWVNPIEQEADDE